MPPPAPPRRPRSCCQGCASAWCCCRRRLRGPMSASPVPGSGDDPLVTVAAVQGNVPRLGLEFNAQRRAVLDNHVRETLRLADDVRAGRARQPMLRHLAGELLGHRPAGQCGRRAGDRRRRRGDRRPHPGRRRDRRARLFAGQPGVHQLGDRVESRDRSVGPPRQADRPALRGVPAVAQLLQPAVAVRRAGRLLHPRPGQRRGARRRGAGRRHHLLGGHLRPRGPGIGAQRRSAAGGARPTTPPSTRR